MAELIALTAISRDEACQPRATTHLDLIEEYATALLDGAQFPPITLFDDGETYWLADGYHRLDAAEAACRAEILADIRLGTRRDAILFSLGANAAHGLRRTNEDKRRAVLTMLRDEEWSGWNDSEIARQCLVNHKTVASIRSTILGNTKIGSPRLVSRNGTTYEMNTALIGGAGDNGWRPATEGRMTLSEAVAALDQRNADRQRIIDTGRRASDHLLDLCTLAVSIAGAAFRGEARTDDDEQPVADRLLFG